MPHGTWNCYPENIHTDIRAAGIVIQAQRQLLGDTIGRPQDVRREISFGCNTGPLLPWLGCSASYQQSHSWINCRYASQLWYWLQKAYGQNLFCRGQSRHELYCKLEHPENTTENAMKPQNPVKHTVVALAITLVSTDLGKPSAVISLLELIGANARGWHGVFLWIEFRNHICPEHFAIVLIISFLVMLWENRINQYKDGIWANIERSFLSYGHASCLAFHALTTV